jgi:hypothetical protein
VRHQLQLLRSGPRPKSLLDEIFDKPLTGVTSAVVLMRRLRLLLVGCVACILVAAAPAYGKGDVRATLEILCSYSVLRRASGLGSRGRWPRLSFQA